jgi:hypothetical protein
MKGKPKFNYGDKVQFTLSDGTYIGTIYIIDMYGTFVNPSDVSYDIMVDDYNGKPCLFKHITEKLVSKL